MIFPVYRGLLFSHKLLKLLFFSSILLVSCTGKTTRIDDNQKIAERPIISYAKRLKIEMVNGYSQVSVINPWQGARNIAQKWYLIPEGGIIPSFIDTSEVIHVPIKKIICMSTTHLSMISALDKKSSVVGFSGTRFIYDMDLMMNVNKGDLREIGYDDNLN